MSELSVVIPTRNRPDLLVDCLTTLQQQADTDFDVVVIDDGSDVPLGDVVAGVVGPVPVRCVRQDPSGLNVGRNTGVAEATGDLIAFLDDDTLVDRGWSSAMRTALREADAVAGRIVLRLEAPAPRWLTERLRSLLAELDLGDDPVPLATPHLPYGANCGVTRERFEAVGGFRPGLDRIGRSLVSNGDTQFFAAVRASGGAIAYAPEAQVEHRISAERLTRDYFRRRLRAQGVSDALTDDDGTTGTLRERLRVARAAPILARGLVTGHGGFGARLWIDYCRGRMTTLRELEEAS